MFRYLPNASKETYDNFEEYLRILNRLEYGSFSEFLGVDTWNIDEMEHIDLLELYRDVRFSPKI